MVNIIMEFGKWECDKCGDKEMEDLCGWWDARRNAPSDQSYCEKCIDDFCPKGCEYLKGDK